MLICTETSSGRYIFPLELKPEDISLKEVYDSLKYLCRFNGHCKHFYSVLSHSVNCCLAAEQQGFDFETCRWALCHDFSEIVLGDIPAPYRPILPDFSALEEKIESVFEKRFNLEGEYLFMKDIDKSMCKLEARYLMKSKGVGEKWDFPTIKLKVKRSDLIGLAASISYKDSVDIFKKFCKKYKVV